MAVSVSLRDRFVGCLLGGALGAPYEGLWGRDIPDGGSLLAGFGEFEGYPPGQFTDDTQLTAATVRAVVEEGEVSPAAIARAIATLFARSEVIGPGGACLAAAHAFLRTGDWETCGAEPGQAGNGTAMRTDPLGLAFLDRPDQLPGVVAAVSRITYRDARNVAGGVAVAKVAQLFACDPGIGPGELCAAVAAAIAEYSPEFAGWVERLPVLLDEPPDVALTTIAWAGMPAPEFDRPVITPFVVPTVLATLWCLLRYPDSWPAAVAAVRLGGDVDMLGAIVGALAGARLGVRAIPEHLRRAVQQSQKLETLALRYHERVTRAT
ncbi:ADP-ribosylglycohydrolase family protein [bacterium]|nr:ADP-ribosylglycohydrolase family protein [bacterium]